VTGLLERPGHIDAFDYEAYLSRYGIAAVMYRSNISSLGEPSGNPLMTHLLSLKRTFEDRINMLYGEPEASFMAGLLTGSRKGIPADLTEAFAVTGLSHIVAISGFNITIVIAVIGGALFWLPLKWRFIPAVAAIVAFTLFVGASAAVVRAAIMGILGLVALQTQRIYHARLGILWTASLMTAWNPRMLWHDAGFQLSFLAVIGLLELGPLLKKIFAWAPETLAVRESLQMTVAAQIMTAPLLALLFERVSLIAPIANLLVAPLIPLAMLFGFLGTIVSFLSFSLGQAIAYLGWACLQWIMAVATLFAAVPFASPGINKPNGMLILGSYILLAGGIFHLQRIKKI